MTFKVTLNLVIYYLHKLKWLEVSSRINYRFVCLIKKYLFLDTFLFINATIKEKNWIFEASSK